MTAEERTQLAALLQRFDATTDTEPVTVALRASAAPVWQGIFNQGHSTATAAHAAKQLELEGQITTLTTERKTLQDKLTELNGKAPEAETLRKQYEAQIAERDGKIQTLQGQLGDNTLANQRTILAMHLAALDVDPEYASQILVNRDDVKGRIRLDKEKGTPLVTQAGLDIPLVAADGKTPLEVLAAELASKVDKKWKTSRVRRGSATDGGSGGGTNIYDEIRTQAKAVAVPAGTPVVPQGVDALTARGIGR